MQSLTFKTIFLLKENILIRTLASFNFVSREQRAMTLFIYVNILKVEKHFFLPSLSFKILLKKLEKINTKSLVLDISILKLKKLKTLSVTFTFLGCVFKLFSDHQSHKTTLLTVDVYNC